MADKAKLNDMVDSMIHQKPEDAQINFHDYMKTKFSDILTKSGDDNNTRNKDKEE